MKFVKAEEGVPAAGYQKKTVRYYDAEGNVRIRFEGSKACVKRKGSTITEYLVQGKEEKRWLTKAEAVILAESGGIHAIVVHTKKGTYLRPEFHAKAFRDLVYC